MATTENLIQNTEKRLNDLQSEIDFTLQENVQGQKQINKNNNAFQRIIERKIALGKDITDEELQKLKDLKINNIRNMVQSGQNISDAQLDFLRQNLTQPLKPEDEKKIKQVQSDIGIRFARGFLQEPEKTRKVVETFIKKKFPDNNVKVLDLDGRLAFSIDGQNYSLLDPKGSEGLGEAAEQIGRFIEPTTEIASSFTPLGPVAGPALTAGLAQTGREFLEASTGDKQGLGRASDIALKAATAGALGRAGELVGKAIGGLAGKGARATVRDIVDINKPVKEGARLLEEEATREIEKKFIKGANPEKFAGFLQRRSQKFYDKLSSEAKKSFDLGRKLADKEGGQFVVDISDNVTNALDDVAIDPAIQEGLEKKLVRILSKSTDKDIKLGDLTLNQASPGQVIKVREAINEMINANKANPNINIGALKTLKTNLGSVIEDLGRQGSKASETYSQGLKTFKELNQRFPEKLQEAILGKSGEFPSQFKEVPKSKILNKLRGEGFDSGDLDKLRDITGIGGRKSAQQLASKNLLADFIVDKAGVRSRSGIRPQELPLEALAKAQQFTDVGALDEAQKRGLKILGDEFTDLVGPSNVSATPQAEFNFRPVAQAITKRSRAGLGAEGFGTGEGLAASKLGDQQAFEEAVKLLNKASDLQLQAQGQAVQFGAEPTAFIGRNTVKAAANVPVLNKLAGLLGGEDLARNIFQTTGTLPEAIPSAVRGLGKAGAGEVELIRSLLGGKPENIKFTDLEQELQAQTGSPVSRLLRGGAKFTEGIDRR